MINKSTDKMIHEKVNSYLEEGIIKLLPLPKEERLGEFSNCASCEPLGKKPTLKDQIVGTDRSDAKGERR